jgi:hypothetical protein
MNPLPTPGSERLDSERAATTREVRQFNGLFMLVNATFLLVTWCCLNALA